MSILMILLAHCSFVCICMCMCMLRLTLEQKELCRSRLKLLSYLDRLATYEVTTITHHHSSTLDESSESLRMVLK